MGTKTIIHDPTRGWLLLTEKWPEKEYLEDSPLWNAILDGEITHCLSTAIEIDPNDWAPVITKAVECAPDSEMESVGGNRFKVKDHHPYSVDAEFEVVTQQLRSDNWKPKEIARLVKAKEVDPSKVIVKPPVMIYEHKSKPEPTETQDELWDELNDECCLGMDDDYTLDVEEAKKRFRIERI